jgi:nickel-dependent lactate racemase
MQIRRVGETSDGIPIELNRALTEHHHIILIGGITFHYFAGFTGGRKLVCPGLASSRTISATHKLAFDCESKSRRAGVDTGLLDGNVVHEAFMEAVAKINPSFAINTIVNNTGDAVDLYCGNWITSHRKACETYAARHTITLAEKRDLVIVSCGGYPFDINMIQAHKALESASHACNNGGTIIFLAECSNGLGRNDFLDWFDAGNSAALAEKLCENYQVNGQTAWSLMKKAETINVQILTSLNQREVTKMRLSKFDNLTEVIESLNEKKEGYILPLGAKYLIES